MISPKLTKSPLATVLVIIALVVVIFYMLFVAFFFYAPCMQKNTPALNFSGLMQCLNYFYKITFIYLVLSLLILFNKKIDGIFNLKGLSISRILVFLMLIAFSIFYFFFVL